MRIRFTGFGLQETVGTALFVGGVVAVGAGAPDLIPVYGGLVAIITGMLLLTVRIRVRW